jgi:hypothetical protein
MSKLTLATIAQPMRADLRQTLVAAALLVTCRPRTAQAALVHILRAGLDAGRITWLLDVVRTCLPIGKLIEEMADVLVQLARSDWLSVRALADEILDAHGRPVPPPPPTEPDPKVRAAFQDLPGRHK